MFILFVSLLFWFCLALLWLFVVCFFISRNLTLKLKSVLKVIKITGLAKDGEIIKIFLVIFN